MEPKLFRLKVNCTQRECPHFNSCPQIPTEVISYTGKPEKIRMMFIGQGGGADEERLHRPFIGVSGKRLREKILPAVFKHLGKKFNYALSNTVRCRPPNNSKPDFTTFKLCRLYLKRDIVKLKPNLLITLGLSSSGDMCMHAHFKSLPLKAYHGTFWQSIVEGFPMMVTYHPSPLNSNPKIPKIIAKDIVRAYNALIEFKGKIDSIEYHRRHKDEII